jgi:ankyrin repeat protein
VDKNASGYNLANEKIKKTRWWGMLSAAVSSTSEEDVESALSALIEIVQKPDAMLYIQQHRAEVGRYFENKTLLNACDHSGYAPLHYAVSEGPLDMVKFLVAQGADINMKNNADETPFILAVLRFYDWSFSDLIPWVQFFIDAGADVSLEDADGKAALEYVFNILEDIIESHDLPEIGLWFSEINFESIVALALKTPRSVLDKISEENNGKSLATAFALLMQQLKLNPALADYKALQEVTTQLSIALMPVDTSKLKYLIAKGALLNLKRYVNDHRDHLFDVDEDGNDLLMLAVMSGYYAMVRYLMKQGFSLTAFNKQGQSALMLSIVFNRINILQYFLKIATKQELIAYQTPGGTALSAAVDSRNMVLCRMVTIALGRKFEGGQLFHLIYSAKSLELEKYLQRGLYGHITHSGAIWSKAEFSELVKASNQFQQINHLPIRLIDERDSEGKTALHHLVALAFYTDVRKQLPFRLFGYQVHSMGSVHGTMLTRYFEMMDILTRFGIDLHALDYQANTALMISAGTPNYLVTADLLKRGLASKINAVNAKGETALMIAARHGFVETVRTLLQCQPNTAMVNHKGQTALDLAKMKGNEDVIALLGAKVAHDRGEDIVSPSKRVKLGY